MAGNWAVYPYNHSNEDPPPEPTKTNRVRLESGDIAADLAAMTMQHSDMSLYNNKQCKLGEDPLCADVDPEALWQRIQGSKKSISALLMDQSYFAGPGNIYRAEILFKAGVHPDVLGRALERSQFDRVWAHTVALLLRGFETGSTLTVDPSEAKALGRCRPVHGSDLKSTVITNAVKSTKITQTAKMAKVTKVAKIAMTNAVSRTASRTTSHANTVKENRVPFNSHCAPESVTQRLQADGPGRLNIREIKSELHRRGQTIVTNSKKAVLVQQLEHVLSKDAVMVSAEDDAMEKAMAGESLAVEHIAELGPSQARKARQRAVATVIAIPIAIKREPITVE